MNYTTLTSNAEKEEEELKVFLERWNAQGKNISQKTSGSTGKPKNIEIPKWKFIASAEMTGDFFNLNECQTALLCISTKYIGGKMMCVRSLLFDLELIVTEVSSNPINNLERSIDFAAMVPLQVETILKENPEKLDLIKYLIIGGAPVSAGLESKLQQSKCTAYSTYGMTETVSHIALKRLNNSASPFVAIGETQFRTINKELIIDCPNLKINSLNTNDIVDLIDSNSFYWKGRKDFIINSGGVKIHPEEVENKIRERTGCNDFIITDIPNKKLGQQVVLIAEEKLKPTLETAISEVKFNQYEAPKKIFYVPSLSYTSSEKIDRRKTRQQILND